MRCMVEIVYIPATGDPVVKTIAWKPGITVKDALDQSLLLETFPELGDLSIGIFFSARNLSNDPQSRR